MHALHTWCTSTTSDTSRRRVGMLDNALRHGPRAAGPFSRSRRSSRIACVRSAACSQASPARHARPDHEIYILYFIAFKESLQNLFRKSKLTHVFAFKKCSAASFVCFANCLVVPCIFYHCVVRFASSGGIRVHMTRRCL